jgi:very-short-patch-repair endonuclease
MEQEMISSKKVYEQLGVKKDYSEWIKRYICNLSYKEGIDYVKTITPSTGGRPSVDYLFSKKKIQPIVIRCNSSGVKDALDYLGLESLHLHTYSRFEVSFSNMLNEALKELGIEVISQYKVLNYRIDFYIPKYKLAIEYDEASHFYSTQEVKDARRQFEIKQEIGCDFKRLNYKDSDATNLGKVLSYIIKNKI